MKALKLYVESKNAWQKLFGKPELDLNLAEDRQAIVNCVLCDLSPENLSRDGELSRAQVMSRKRQLEAVLQDMRQLDPGLSIEEVY